MHVQQPRYSKEEHARRGMEMYEQSVRAQVEGAVVMGAGGTDL